MQVVQAGHADVGERELAELREAVGRRLERAEDGGGRCELEQAVGAEHGHEAHLVRVRVRVGAGLGLGLGLGLGVEVRVRGRGRVRLTSKPPMTPACRSTKGSLQSVPG